MLQVAFLMSVRRPSAAAASPAPARKLRAINVPCQFPNPAGMAAGPSSCGFAGAGEAQRPEAAGSRANGKRSDRQPSKPRSSVLSAALAQAQANLRRLQAYRDRLKRGSRTAKASLPAGAGNHGLRLGPCCSTGAMGDGQFLRGSVLLRAVSAPPSSLVTYGNSPQNLRHAGPMLHDPYSPDRRRHVPFRRHPKVPLR